MSKEEMKNLDKLKTELMIPTKPGPEDPYFIMAMHSGWKLTEREARDYYKWRHEKQFKKMKKQLLAPTKQQMS